MDAVSPSQRVGRGRGVVGTRHVHLVVGTELSLLHNAWCVVFAGYGDALAHHGCHLARHELGTAETLGDTRRMVSVLKQQPQNTIEVFSHFVHRTFASGEIGAQVGAHLLQHLSTFSSSYFVLQQCRVCFLLQPHVDRCLEFMQCALDSLRALDRLLHSLFHLRKLATVLRRVRLAPFVFVHALDGLVDALLLRGHHLGEILDLTLRLHQFCRCFLGEDLSCVHP
mmetsp:Transcript_14793/g.34759  ORF Transcript_14793/g.34759 Transcript_14793/m.34759 type:complete len:225 (-) Transcript_14793:173-847(-)